MAILIINGPNLNLLGKREKNIYGDQSFDDYFSQLRQKYAQADLQYFQSNSEAAIIDKIHEVGFDIEGIIINAGAFTHTSVAIRDAIAGVTSPVIEVHISNVHVREEFRHKSYLSAVCKGVIFGFGLDSYRLAVEHFLNG
jgi:3-dehydroquinate dehydratase-2